MLEKSEFPDIPVLITAIGCRIAGFTSLGPYKTKQERGLSHGHTIGHDEHHKFTVHHEPSTIASGQTVYRLYLTSIPKP
jgi:hypothetical protein